ncbi:MAG: LysR family transcriptional regulator [Pseudobutyrivibrio sp.]|nr:LysR family transcriptional regulator [Pseudobutyrivibrio sp.]
MELKQMEYFKTIVDCGSISEAARILHMSQPPLSMSMKKLEAELDATLFVRGNKHINLTEAGAIFYQRICGILQLTDNTISEVTRASMGKTIALGLTPSTIPFVSDMLAKFALDNPDLHFDIYDGSTFEMEHLLDTKTIDAAFLRSPFAPGNLITREIKKEPMMAAIPSALLDSSSKIKNGRPISVKELGKFPLSIYRRYQSTLTSLFSKENLIPNYFSICDDTRTTLLWTRNNQAVSVVPKSLIDNENEFIICPIKSKELETSIMFVHPMGIGSPPPAIAQLIPYLDLL